MNKKKTSKLRDKELKWLKKQMWTAVGMVVCFAMTMSLVGGIYWWFIDRPLPGVKLAGYDVGNVHREDIIRFLQVDLVMADELVLMYENREFRLKLAELNYQVDRELSAEKVVGWSKDWGGIKNYVKNLVRDFWRGGFLARNYSQIDLALEFQINESWLNNKLAGIADELYVPAVPPEVLVRRDEENLVMVNNGSVGQTVIIDSLRGQVLAEMASGGFQPIRIPIEKMDLRVGLAEQQELKTKAEMLLDKELILVDEDERFIWKGADLAELLSSDGLNESKLNNELKKIAELTEKQAANAVFVFNEETGRVEEFSHEVVGKELAMADVEAAVKNAIDKLLVERVVLGENFMKDRELGSGAIPGFSAEVHLVYDLVHPDVKVGDVNELGIKDLLGRGESRYKGSINERKFNVSLGAERIRGVLIPPGEMFSFNANVGEVSAATGYKKSYVIRSGETVLDDGGGMCQVSTTVFRAALNAGLPIVERKAHSYRVGYYEQDTKPGLDATVYAPSVDLKFLNDTPGYILVQTSVDEGASALTVDIFGTSDGRVAEIGNQRVWDVTEPPEDRYVDDPGLHVGQVKQVEYKAWGAKAAFDWKVTRDGEVLQERTFYSNYVPWGAVYLKGVGN